MDESLEALREKVVYILDQTIVVVDSSVVFDFHLQNLWCNLQETFPNLASTDITVGEWETHAPIGFEERMNIIEWGKSLSTTTDSTFSSGLQDLPTFKLPCGVTVYPATLLQGGTETCIRKADNSQIQLVQFFENTGQSSSLLSSNYSQMNKLKNRVWDYKFALGLLVAVGSLSSNDTRIEEMIKKDRDWEQNFDYPRYLSEDFPAKVKEAYKRLSEQDK